VALAAAAVVLIGACSSSSSPHPTTATPCRVTQPLVAPNAPVSAPTVPSGGAYFGGFALHGVPTQSNYVTSFAALAQAACRPLDLAHVYLRWDQPFPTVAAESLAREQVAQLVSWTGTDTRVINSGAVDSVIRATARQVALLRSPVFLEFRWEMDRQNLASVVHRPADYIAAWDRVRRLFAAVGTPNVSWVWCPTAGGFAAGRAQRYYPGDNRVDWVCADAYPDPFHLPVYRPFRHIVRPFLNWTKQHDRPVMIGEFGVPQSYPPQQRAAWLDDARTTITQGRRIKAAAYFDADPVGNPPTLRYRLGDDATVIAAWRRLANDPYFGPPGSS
jgi:beta-mannanase